MYFIFPPFQVFWFKIMDEEILWNGNISKDFLYTFLFADEQALIANDK